MYYIDNIYSIIYSITMQKKIGRDGLTNALKQYLSRMGQVTAQDICKQLEISQPTFSRLVTSLDREILKIGKAQSTKYALIREISGIGSEIPIYEIGEQGKSLHIANLHGIMPKGFYLEAKTVHIDSNFFEDLPYFLDDLRPNGFLGRLIPRQHPELNLPNDIRLWSADQCLQYLARFGADIIGNFIIGNDAFKLYLSLSNNPPTTVANDERPIVYPKMAHDVLDFGPAGSSAGGEQPKFLTTMGPTNKHVLVKFSPPVRDDISRRFADIIVCEHIAHQVLSKHGFTTAKSQLIKGGEQFFLEIERFDRTGENGRRGLISLNAMAVEFTGTFGTWGEISKELLRQKIINEEDYQSICALEIFGHLTANTDMHAANLSFFSQKTKIINLAPTYDMLPMMYAPSHSSLIDRPFEPPPPNPQNAVIWKKSHLAAVDFWNEVAGHGDVSSDFKSIANVNVEKVASLEKLYKLLPTG